MRVAGDHDTFESVLKSFTFLCQLGGLRRVGATATNKIHVLRQSPKFVAMLAFALLTLTIVLLLSSRTESFRGVMSDTMVKSARRCKLQMMLPAHHVGDLQSLLTGGLQQFRDSSSWLLSEEAVSVYSKIDKTGFIGFIATYIEVSIDFFRQTFNNVGIENAYGPAIILFTIFGK